MSLHLILTAKRPGLPDDRRTIEPAELGVMFHPWQLGLLHAGQSLPCQSVTFTLETEPDATRGD